jgi:hypothetical protein
LLKQGNGGKKLALHGGFVTASLQHPETTSLPQTIIITDFCVRFEVSTAVTMKNAVFWDKKHRSYLTGNIMSPLQSPASYCHVRFQVSTAVTMKNAVFWDKKHSLYLTGNTCLR